MIRGEILSQYWRQRTPKEDTESDHMDILVSSARSEPGLHCKSFGLLWLVSFSDRSDLTKVKSTSELVGFVLLTQTLFVND